jgi:hypothetical protein
MIKQEVIMAAADTKELAQCLALAYFAEHPTYENGKKDLESPHAVGFYSLFSGKESVAMYKTKYLSEQFPIDKLKKEFIIVTDKKTGKVKYHDTARKVYRVAQKFIEYGIISASQLHNYKILDQEDKFVLLLKNTTLYNIKKAFKLPFRIDVLSSVDIMLVRKTSIVKIKKEFEQNFSDDKTILMNSIWSDTDGNTYNNLLQAYLKSKELIQISLKLPTTLSSYISIKKVDFTDLGVAEDIDPYVKLLSAILHDPQNTKKYIEEAINIRFSEFSTGNVLNWVFPVMFNYEKVLHPITKQPLSKHNLKFNLFSQGYGVGWNGQFDLSTVKYQNTQWTGGISVYTFEYFAKAFQDYDKVIKKVVEIRARKFDEICDEFKKKYQDEFNKIMTDYKEASKIVRQDKILFAKVDRDKLKNFFNNMQGSKNITMTNMSLSLQYEISVIEEISDNSSYSPPPVSNSEEYINAHFVHAQLSYFMFYGGKHAELYMKQRMFIMIFGIITKKSYKAINLTDYGGMKNIIQESIIHDGKKVMAEFASTPHYIIS